METIRGVRSFIGGVYSENRVGNTKVRKDDGCEVTSFLDLTWKVAQLQFSNPEHMLLFRGQERDYLNYQGNTSLKPSIFHHREPTNGMAIAEQVYNPRVRNLSIPEGPLTRNFEKLKEAERELNDAYRVGEHDGKMLMNRYRILRWAILQHYEVCGTPLLDVTQSLRVAASFACLENSSTVGYVYVLGVPNLSGTLTASAEAGLQVIRLSGICPATARRPHVQQGYLLGEYPEMGDWNQKERYPQNEIDPARRLVAKFKINPLTFWANNAQFPMIDREGLYQEQHDTLFQLTRPVKEAIERNS